jgi:hypothetical protein
MLISVKRKCASVPFMRYCKQVNQPPPTMPTATAARHPFSAAEWASLKRLAKIIHKWNEDECNGAIQWHGDNGETPKRYFQDRYGCYTIPGPTIQDKEKQSLESARKIAAKHGLSVYHQPDPRGCSLYVYNVHDLKGREIDECYSVLARPVI